MMMGMPRPSTRVFVDVDTGIDDALALIFAASDPGLDLVGVSAVVGNVAADVAARNSVAVLTAVGRSPVPVVIGAEATASGNGPRAGPTNHGADGLGGVHVDRPSSTSDAHADPIALLHQVSSSSPVTVAACAPLTNVARYASQPGVERIVLVGGELVVEAEPEFNIGHDPISAAAVLDAEVPTTVFTIDVFETIRVPPTTVAALTRSDEPASRLAGELLAVRRGHLLGDAGALVLLAHPELFVIQRERMIVLDGRLVVSRQPDAGREVDVVVAADGSAVVDAFVDAVTSTSGP